MIFVSNSECRVGPLRCASCFVSGLQARDLLSRINGKKSSDFGVLEDGIKGRKKRETPASNIISQIRR